MFKKKTLMHLELEVDSPLIMPLLSEVRTQWKFFYSCLFLIIPFLEMRSPPAGLPGRAEAVLQEQAVVLWHCPPGAGRAGLFHSLCPRPHRSGGSTGICFCFRWDCLPFLARVCASIKRLLLARGMLPQKLQQKHKRKMLILWFEKKLLI